MQKKQKRALLLLHEIYGKNQFMQEQCAQYQRRGFDVYCPDFLSGTVFSYEEMDLAYSYFYEKTGAQTKRSIDTMMEALRKTHDEVFVLGFSAGATFAWRCSENVHCTGIICCYGSRIRDYMAQKPACPVLLLFAEQDAFEVQSVAEKLKHLPHTQVHTFAAAHGFMDPYSKGYHPVQAAAAQKEIDRFLHIASCTLPNHD